MKYLVMETHPAYAVVLDESGHFLKVANLRYQVGDTVQEVIPLRPGEKSRPRLWKTAAALAGAAACLCVAFFGYYRPNFTAYGTLRIQINPDVEMTISRTERVLGLQGLNDDGALLIQGYDYRGKTRDTATDELVERAIDMGYLSDGDTISITVNSSDPSWREKEEEQVRTQLEDRYGESVVIRLDSPDSGQASSPGMGEVVIPAVPQSPGDSNYQDTDYGPNNDGITDYGDTDYGPNNDGVTDYGDTDYGPNNDGVTDYGDTDYGPNNDGVTDYGDTDYGPNNDGATDYKDTHSSSAVEAEANGQNSDYDPGTSPDDQGSGDTNYQPSHGASYTDGDTDYADRDTEDR